MAAEEPLATTSTFDDPTNNNERDVVFDHLQSRNRDENERVRQFPRLQGSLGVLGGKPSRVYLPQVC